MKTSAVLLLVCLTANAAPANELREISQAELRDKIHGYWIGQLVGNFLGFPFENVYIEETIPVSIDRYFTYKDAETYGLRMNLDDRRAFVPMMADALGGAWSDDDTDIEFVTLHAVEKYGLDLNYEQLTGMWKRHINRYIWSSARIARDLMEDGLLPPETGSREHNERWWGISSQLMTEIWGAFYPGMPDKAAERGLWNARVKSDSWATHPDIVYTSMYSAAFFETDVQALIAQALPRLPADSPFRRGIEEILAWHAEGLPWEDVRQRLHVRYYEEIDGFRPSLPVLGAIINGLCGVMALLYGDGDFALTLSIAVQAGYDCDNQAATLGGLLGIMHGANAIPERYTHDVPSRGRWTKPFNNTYINYSRDDLPNFNRISDIVDRILSVSETAILAQGGEKRQTPDGQWIYAIRK